MNKNGLFTEKNIQNLANNNGGVVQLNKASKLCKAVLPYIDAMKQTNDLTVIIENGKLICFSCKKDFRITIKATVENAIAESKNLLNAAVKRLILLGDKNRIAKIQVVLSRLEKL